MKNVMSVDKEKLILKLRESGFTMESFSRTIGRNGSYVAAMVRKHNGINQSTVMLLDSVANIKYDDIKSEEKQVTKKCSRFISDSEKNTRFGEFLNEVLTSVSNTYVTVEEMDRFMLQLNFVVKAMDGMRLEPISEIKNKLVIYGVPIVHRNENGTIERKFMEER